MIHTTTTTTAATKAIREWFTQPPPRQSMNDSHSHHQGNPMNTSQAGPRNCCTARTTRDSSTRGPRCCARPFPRKKMLPGTPVAPAATILATPVATAECARASAPPPPPSRRLRSPQAAVPAAEPETDGPKGATARPRCWRQQQHHHQRQHDLGPAVSDLMPLLPPPFEDVSQPTSSPPPCAGGPLPHPATLPCCHRGREGGSPPKPPHRCRLRRRRRRRHRREQRRCRLHGRPALRRRGSP